MDDSGIEPGVYQCLGISVTTEPLRLNDTPYLCIYSIHPKYIVIERIYVPSLASNQVPTIEDWECYHCASFMGALVHFGVYILHSPIM